MAQDHATTTTRTRTTKTTTTTTTDFNWKTLSTLIMQLNQENYAKQSNTIVIELQSLLVADADVTRNISLSVMYILYERAMRELVTNSFPISANIIESLGSNPDILNTFQSLTRTHVQDLLKKLEKCTQVLTCTDVGIIFSLLSLHRLDQMGGKQSHLTKIFDKVVDSTLTYTATFKEYNNANLLMMLAYALIMYALTDEKLNDKTVRLLNFVKRGLVVYGADVSNFTKVLILDIMERIQNNKPTQLYEAIYKKVFQPDIYIIPDLNEFINSVPYPGNNHATGSVPNEKPASIPNGGIHTMEEEKNKSSSAMKATPDMNAPTTAASCVDVHKVDVIKETILEESVKAQEDADTKQALQWSISQMQEPEPVERVTEILEVPENCIGRVVGFQGAIARKLELESNAVIEVCNPEEPARPDTSCLTAHKLVTGSLGLPSQMAAEQVAEEKQKLSDAKVRRLTEERGEQMRVIKITGSEDEINTAVTLIKDIITCGVTIHVHLDFTVDEILEKYSGKLKTIEFLLNIHLEVEELENQNVVLNISGDAQSCQDAKKLIFDEVGSFRSQHGHLFFIPKEMMRILKSESGVKKLVRTVHMITNARILPLNGDDGSAIFISGYQHQVNRTLQIFQKVNADVMCSTIVTDGNRELNTEAVCHFVKETYKRNGSRSDNKISRSTSLTTKKESGIVAENGPVKSRVSYSKETLLELSKSKSAQSFPEKLVLLDDPEVKEIILYECTKTCCAVDWRGKQH